MNEFLNIKNTLVWDKHSGPGNFYSYSHEFIIFGTNNSKFGYGKKPGRNVINNIPSFTTGSRAKEGNGDKVHPTQKTVEIIEKFILDSTEEGGTVLDCFGGSGTTAVAAKKTGRNYILFEIQKKYCDIAKRRIEQI